MLNLCGFVHQEGDIVNVDVSAFYKGYHGDLNETYLVGNCDEASKNLVSAAYQVVFLYCLRHAALPLRTLRCSTRHALNIFEQSRLHNDNHPVRMLHLHLLSTKHHDVARR